MSKTDIIEQAFGKLQIYIQPKEKVQAENLMHRLRSRQLYREIVKYAKEDHLINASVYQTQHGYSLHGKISSRHVELANEELCMCVELIDEKEKLEAFCLKHAGLLKGKMIVFKPVEFWQIK